jgi:hypothetical protein
MKQPSVPTSQANSLAGVFTRSYQAALTEFVARYKSNHRQMDSLQEILHRYPSLLTGDYYARSVSDNGIEFSHPDLYGNYYDKVLAWSRISDDKEILCAVNLDQYNSASFYVTIDNDLQEAGTKMYCLFATDNSPKELNVEVRNGKSIRLTIPPGGMVFYGGNLG